MCSEIACRMRERDTKLAGAFPLCGDAAAFPSVCASVCVCVCHEWSESVHIETLVHVLVSKPTHKTVWNGTRKRKSDSRSNDNNTK